MADQESGCGAASVRLRFYVAAWLRRFGLAVARPVQHQRVTGALSISQDELPCRLPETVTL